VRLVRPQRTARSRAYSSRDRVVPALPETLYHVRTHTSVADDRHAPSVVADAVDGNLRAADHRVLMNLRAVEAERAELLDVEREHEHVLPRRDIRADSNGEAHRDPSLPAVVDTGASHDVGKLPQ